MRSYQTCSGCGSYVQLEELRAPCQLCGAEMCVRCMKECEECGKEICRNCYRGKGLCSVCSNWAFTKDSWNQTKSDDGLTQAAGAVKAFAGLALTAREYGKAKEERRKNEGGQADRVLASYLKGDVHRYICESGSVTVSDVALRFGVSRSVVVQIFDELEREGVLKDAD